jgi:type IV pilus assembly protein PilM
MFSTNFLVLEFGSYNIKLILATTNSKGLRIERMNLIPTTEGCISNGTIVDAEKVAEIVAAHMKKNNIKTKKTKITITTPAMTMREVLVLNHKKEVIKSFIEIEASNFFPMDLSKCVVDYKIIPDELGNPDTTEHKILIAAIPSEIINGYLEVAKILALDVDTVEFASDSISKLYAKRKHFAKPNEKSADIITHTPVSTVFIDIGAEMTNVTITTDNVIKYNKILNFGASNINRLIPQEEQFEKRGFDLFNSISNFEQDNVDKQIKTALTDFFDDIRAFFDFHISRKTGNKIDQIILIGGGATQLGMLEVFQETFSGNISVGFEFEDIRFGFKTVCDKEEILYFYNCIGACVKL